MRYAKRIVACALLFVMLGCSCELNNAPSNPVDGTPLDSSSVSLEASSDMSSSASSEVSSNASVSSQLPEINHDDGVKRVAFTFDDGPSTTYTRKIVDKLNSYGGRGTFFVIGNLIGEQNGANIKYAVDNGCEIGIHAWSHKYSYSKCSDETYNSEINKTADVIRKYIPGYDIKLMRPVGGNITDERVRNSPYAVINWSIDSNDWRYKKQDTDTAVKNIYDNVMYDIEDGDIILFHEIYSNSWAGFCKIVDELDEQGYEFVTVSELLGKDGLKPGKKYLRREKPKAPESSKPTIETSSENASSKENGNNANSNNGNNGNNSNNGNNGNNSNNGNSENNGNGNGNNT